MRRLIVAAALALAAAGMTTQAAPAQAGVPWLVTIHVESVRAWSATASGSPAR